MRAAIAILAVGFVTGTARAEEPLFDMGFYDAGPPRDADMEAASPAMDAASESMDASSDANTWCAESAYGCDELGQLCTSGHWPSWFIGGGAPCWYGSTCHVLVCDAPLRPDTGPRVTDGALDEAAGPPDARPSCACAAAPHRPPPALGALLCLALFLRRTQRPT